VFASKASTAAVIGSKPRLARIDAEIATGAPKPAMPSIRAPKLKATSRAWIRRSVVRCASERLMTAKSPLATARPGFGLMLLGRWGRGATLTVLTAGAFYFASADSPDSTIFADYGRFGAVPPAYPRAAGWLLLSAAVALYVLAIALTVWERRKLQKEMNSS